MGITVRRVALAIAGFLGIIVFTQCGGQSSSTTQTQQPGTVAPPAAPSLSTGSFNLNCPGEEQSQQATFEQQSQPGCGQTILFEQADVSDFSFNLDCNSRELSVQNSGPDPKKVLIPLQSDGSVRGSMQFQNQIQDDGHGNQFCWVQFRVDFDGKADCAAQSVNVSTSVAFQATEPAAIPSPSASPSALVTSSPIPFHSPSSTPSPSPSPSRTGSPQPTHTPPPPHPVPVVFCIIENPCPVVATTQLSCPNP